MRSFLTSSCKASCGQSQSSKDQSAAVQACQPTAPKILQALDLGADDYLVKRFLLEILLARISAIVRRLQNAEPANIQVGGITCFDHQRGFRKIWEPHTIRKKRESNGAPHIVKAETSQRLLFLHSMFLDAIGTA